MFTMSTCFSFTTQKIHKKKHCQHAMWLDRLDLSAPADTADTYPAADTDPAADTQFPSKGNSQK